jgi:hypothetical protein
MLHRHLVSNSLRPANSHISIRSAVSMENVSARDNNDDDDDDGNKVRVRMRKHPSSNFLEIPGHFGGGGLKEKQRLHYSMPASPASGGRRAAPPSMPVLMEDEVDGLLEQEDDIKEEEEEEEEEEEKEEEEDDEFKDCDSILGAASPVCDDVHGVTVEVIAPQPTTTIAQPVAGSWKKLRGVLRSVSVVKSNVIEEETVGGKEDELRKRSSTSAVLKNGGGWKRKTDVVS